MCQVPLCQQRSAFVWLHRRDTFDRADDQRFMGMPSTMRLIDESSGRRLIKVSLIAMAREIKVTFRMLMLIAPGQQCPVDSQLIIAFARCWHTKTCQNWVATKVETTFASLLFFRGPPINLDLPYSDSGPSEAKIINYMQIIIFMQCLFSQPWEPRELHKNSFTQTSQTTSPAAQMVLWWFRLHRRRNAPPKANNKHEKLFISISMGQEKRLLTSIPPMRGSETESEQVNK